MSDTWNDTIFRWMSWDENLKRWVLAAQGIIEATSATPTGDDNG